MLCEEKISCETEQTISIAGGFSSSTDEYVKKPFYPEILLARAKKLLKLDQSITFADIRLDLTAKKIYKKEEDLNVTKTEYELLRFF